MINSIRENRRVRGAQKTMRDRNDDYSYKTTVPLEFKDSMSKEDHEKHQLEWKISKRKSQIKLGILIGGVLLFLAVFLCWLGT
jgi:hypothetical protein